MLEHVTLGWLLQWGFFSAVGDIMIFPRAILRRACLMQPVVCGFGAMIHFTQLSMLQTIVTAHMLDFPYYRHVFQAVSRII
jgi:hypothetical protein